MRRVCLLLFLIFSVSLVWGQGLETFDNFDEPGTGYQDGTFIGQDGSIWTYVQCRGDHEITGTAIMIGRNRDPQSNFYSGTISGGIGKLNFNYKQAFSTDVDLEVYINDVLVGSVTTDDEQGIVKNSGEIQVNVAGDFVIKFINRINSAGQVVVDDVEWTGYVPPSISNIIQEPEEVTSTDDVSVSADITEGDAAIDKVELHWNTDNDFDTYTTINMSLDAGDTYITDTDIPAQSDGTTVYYRIYAEDVEEESTTSDVYSYQVLDPISISQSSVPFTEDFESFEGDHDPQYWTTTDFDPEDSSDWLGQNHGTSTTGGKYSYGLEDDDNRALGFLPSGDKAIYVDIVFSNDIGEAISYLEISYAGEHWRSANDGRENGWAVSYKIGDGVFEEISELTYIAPNTKDSGALDGNLEENREIKTHTISGINILPDAQFTIRFFGDNGTGSGARQGVAIDDFSLTAYTESDPPLPVTLEWFKAEYVGNEAVLSWQTASETNNLGWNLYRADDSDEPEMQLNAMLIEGAGTTSQTTGYSYTDPYNVVPGNTYYYWLESKDLDGSTELFGPASLQVPIEGEVPSLPEKTKLRANFPNPFNPDTYISFDIRAGETGILQIYDLRGRVIEKLEFPEGSHFFHWQPQQQSSGIYIYRLQTESYSETKKMLLLK